MSSQTSSNFDQKAAQWDDDPVRAKLGNDVADSFIRELNPSIDMDALDFGCGTGLVTLRLRPLVRQITGVDSSKGMLAVLERKIKTQGLGNVRTQFVDFERGDLPQGAYDLIVSSMTLHHVPEPAPLIRHLTSLLRPGGSLCIADLDAEDGSFHPDNTGVHHSGFDRNAVAHWFGDAGLSGLRQATAAVVKKATAQGLLREFPVFLVIGKK